MSKISEYQESLLYFFQQKDEAAIQQYLVDHANLPSPQMNLSLTEAFANCFQIEAIQAAYQDTVLKWSNLTCGNDEPELMLPFCAVRAMGYFFNLQNEQHHNILSAAMEDTRWRMRESAAMCLQHIGEQHCDDLMTYLTSIYPASTYMQKRAILAGLAHPKILKQNTSLCMYALQMCDHILQDVYTHPYNRKEEGYLVLYKGLSYVISVFSAYAPDAGFTFMKQWTAYPDADVKRIIKANLSKGRIAKPFPKECAEIKDML